MQGRAERPGMETKNSDNIGLSFRLLALYLGVIVFGVLIIAKVASI
jgi:hypothetical protein